MCSYNQINNSYGCQNSKLLNNVLKDELGFQGFVMSDWQAQHTGVASALAGLDMTMPGDTTFNTGFSYWGTNLTLAVVNGTVPEWRLDDMVMRIMAAYFKVGLTLNEPGPNFDSWTLNTFGYEHASVNQGFKQVNWHVDVRANHASVIREVAGKGTVLLKNNGILPLNKPKFVAVIGEDAGSNPAGPNGCGDRGCDDGTLAIGWGSGTASFPYLVTPDAALQAQALKDGTIYQSILSNYEASATEALVTQANVTAIVFVNADSGEGYINVGGNEGDRLNLTAWKNGDDLVKSVASWNPNTIVVIHSTGAILLGDYESNPNISAIVWAGLPGQESGNSLVDVLYGTVNPSGRSPFTWGASRQDYGTDILYTPNNGLNAPQVPFSEGVFIDYRYFDKYNTSVVYEFGYGLSYTTFEYSNLQVQKSNAGAYTPTTGTTPAAPSFGNFSTNLADYLFPSSQFSHVWQYIYPYVNTTDAKAASADPFYGETADKFTPANSTNGSPQPLLRSAGKNAPGGNNKLYDTIYTITVDIKNTGSIVGDEVPQLYVSLGGPNDPKVLLRDFDRIRIDAGQTTKWTGTLTRRDLSNWDTNAQDWVVSSYPKTVYVGRSSRKLDLSAPLN